MLADPPRSSASTDSGCERISGATTAGRRAYPETVPRSGRRPQLRSNPHAARRRRRLADAGDSRATLDWMLSVLADPLIRPARRRESDGVYLEVAVTDDGEPGQRPIVLPVAVIHAGRTSQASVERRCSSRADRSSGPAPAQGEPRPGRRIYRLMEAQGSSRSPARCPAGPVHGGRHGALRARRRPALLAAARRAGRRRRFGNSCRGCRIAGPGVEIHLDDDGTEYSSGWAGRSRAPGCRTRRR